VYSGAFYGRKISRVFEGQALLGIFHHREHRVHREKAKKPKKKMLKQFRLKAKVYDQRVEIKTKMRACEPISKTNFLCIEKIIFFLYLSLSI